MATATLAAGVALLPKAAWMPHTESRLAPLDALSLDAFAAQCRSVFLARDGAGQAVALTLVQAERIPTRSQRPAQAAGETFALRFEGAAEPGLSQETYAFEHAKLGCFDLFIVPVGQPGRPHTCYEAIINRLGPAATARAGYPAATPMI
jgi:hypothetical protein